MFTILEKHCAEALFICCYFVCVMLGNYIGLKFLWFFVLFTYSAYFGSASKAVA